jgi:predicted ferric reductase
MNGETLAGSVGAASLGAGSVGAGQVGIRPAPTGRSLRTPGWWRDAVTTATWCSLLIVVVLWVHGGGLRELHGGPAAVTSAGRLTGLLACDLLLIQVLLMARIPVLERVWGQDELARRHRLLGMTSFTLMVGHIVAVTVGYAGQDAQGVIGQFWDLVVNYPGMLLAAAGTALLVLVAASSARRARRRLRYESWHLLHLYDYLGVGLALPNQLWTGQDFVTNRAATAYWWSVWVATAGAVLIWRVGVPVARSLRHQLRVSEAAAERPGVVSVLMTGRQLDRLPVAAGQFFLWRFLNGPGWSRAHPYSLSAAPDGTSLRITVADLGDGSRALAAIRPGTRVLIEGPYGRLHRGVRERRRVTLLAGGIGITPLRALLEELPGGPGELTLIYRSRSSSEVIFRAELDELAARRGARVVYALGPRVAGRASWLPADAAHMSDVEALRHLVPDVADNDVYLCGAPDWMAAARRAALAAGVPANNVHCERFDW